MKRLFIVEIPSIGGKAYLVEGEEESILVDTLFPGNGKRIIKFLNRRGINLHKIKLILITHGHIDHYGSALELKGEIEAPIAIHELDANGPGRGINVHIYPRSLLQKVLDLYVSRQRTQPFEPDVLLKGEEGDFKDYGIAAKWIRTPGHTQGSVSVVLPGEAAIVGDLITGKFGFLKKTAHPLWVEDVEQSRESIGKLLDCSPKIFFAGHGGPFDPEEVRRVFLK
jgi:glyoxylase-like metal-dependent hydrolase (beta-lactamase superfamily II)